MTDYHHSLLNRSRQYYGEDRFVRPAQLSRSSKMALMEPTYWASCSSDSNKNNNTGKPAKKKKKVPASGLGSENDELPMAPPPSRQELEEYERLPMAIRRKYFSTLERLRLAKSSGILNGILVDKPQDISDNNKLDDKVQLDAELRRTIQDASVTPNSSPLYRGQAVSAVSLPLLQSQPKPKQDHLTRQEQIAIARQLRESVILDAADEAIYKIGRRAGRQFSSDMYIPTLSSTRPSVESPVTEIPSPQTKDTRESLYDSFRWLDEDEDLDLRLYLDDYHSNLREALPPTQEFRPSFRRHLSINKIPFNRPSVSSTRPTTNNGPSDPTLPTSVTATNSHHIRRKSRALSLITPKHAAHRSLSSIDVAATHYQDPEARMKLRVYLASPQKFDEAIEFGFPSNDVLSGGVRPASQHMGQRRAYRGMSEDSEGVRTFLSDDKSSIHSDEDTSLPDPESPRTPHTPDRLGMKLPRPQTEESDHPHRGLDHYAQAPVASREMTLRMTLTRPDLRACEDQIYGWQQNVSQQQGHRFSQMEPMPLSTATYVGDNRPRDSLEKFCASLDEVAPVPPQAAQPSDGHVFKKIKNLFQPRNS